MRNEEFPSLWPIITPLSFSRGAIIRFSPPPTSRGGGKLAPRQLANLDTLPRTSIFLRRGAPDPRRFFARDLLLPRTRSRDRRYYLSPLPPLSSPLRGGSRDDVRSVMMVSVRSLLLASLGLLCWLHSCESGRGDNKGGGGGGCVRPAGCQAPVIYRTAY